MSHLNLRQGTLVPCQRKKTLVVSLLPPAMFKGPVRSRKKWNNPSVLKRLANMSGCHHFQHRSVEHWCMLQKNKKHSWSKIETYIRINKHKSPFCLSKGCGLKILPSVIITNNFWLTQFVSCWGDMVCVSWAWTNLEPKWVTKTWRSRFCGPDFHTDRKRHRLQQICWIFW